MFENKLVQSKVLINSSLGEQRIVDSQDSLTSPLAGNKGTISLGPVIHRNDLVLGPGPAAHHGPPD